MPDQFMIVGYQILLKMQLTFSYDICSLIFNEDTEHFWNKWLNTQNNMLLFLKILNIVNRNKMLEWGEQNL